MAAKITISPSGLTLACSISDAAGPINAYSDLALGTSLGTSFAVGPAATVVYVAEDGMLTVSAKLNGIELGPFSVRTETGSDAGVSVDPRGDQVRQALNANKGRELAAATIATTATASLTTTPVDIAGTAVGPVIGSNGVYIDVIGSFGATTAATLIIQLYDTTASAVVCQQTLVTVAGGTGLPFAMRARVAPAPGARSYKLRWATGSGTATGAYYGTDQGQATGVYVVER